MAEQLGVADAKRRFSELIDRVKRGERFVVMRRGKPAVGLVPPSRIRDTGGGRPIGLAGIAGALADWADLDETVKEIYAGRRKATDRAAPELR